MPNNKIATNNKFLDKLKSAKIKKKTPTNKRKLAEDVLKVTGNPRLLFSMDATASREASWEIAKKITVSMFKAMPDQLDIALAYHSDSQLQEVTPFSDQPKAFLDKVMTVRCSAGSTALNEILEEAVNIPRLKVICYTGDCHEEYENESYELAEKLKAKGVRIFIFHDWESSKFQGYDTDSARDVFERICEITNGVIFDFNQKAPSKIKSYLEAIAVFAGGGMAALESKKNQLPGAKLLLEKLD